MQEYCLKNRKEAAEALRISVRTLDSYVTAGAIGCVRIPTLTKTGTGRGRVLFRQSDLDLFVASHSKPSKAA
jgi:predicted site-specific integrase-resolvase